MFGFTFELSVFLAVQVIDVVLVALAIGPSRARRQLEKIGHYRITLISCTLGLVPLMIVLSILFDLDALGEQRIDDWIRMNPGLISMFCISAFGFTIVSLAVCRPRGRDQFWGYVAYWGRVTTSLRLLAIALLAAR